MNLKLDADDYRDRRSGPPPGDAAARDPRDRPLGAPAAARVNWKIVRALGLALLVWGLIAAVLLSL